MRSLVFWSSIAIVLYTFAIYPLLLVGMASVSQIMRDFRFAFTRRNRRRQPAGELPFVSLIVCAHNEEAIIADKLGNCLRLDYPADRLEILLGCDGCTDRTAAIAAGSGMQNLRVFDFPRSGKPATLNRLVPEARGELLVFSDANSLFEPDTVSALVRRFEDGAVGCVCGELRLRAGAGGGSAEGFYWRYETLLKFFESRLNILVGANGGVFAIRRDLYDPLPPGTITDDFIISMRIRSRGWKVVYDPEAVAYEDAPNVRQEFRRRMRIGAGNVHALKYTWRLLNPAAGLVAFSYWSHKVFRWLAPAAMPVALASSFLLAGTPLPYGIAASFGTLTVLMAIIGYWAARRNSPAGVFTTIYYFYAMNIALLAGVVSYACGRRSSVWAPTARAEQTAGQVVSAGAGQ